MKISSIEKLINWYKKNKRELPWRDTNNPYDVWLSEIMLQQTRIEAVIPKFLLFKNELPTIEDLSKCDDDHLMRLWEGLGYYSRARNLKKCANVLVKEYDGKLPSTYHELIHLPGIGPYTAGAIASIAFNEKVTAIDGNVLRIIARVYGIKDDILSTSTKTKIKELLEPFYVSIKSPKDLNQAWMELGQRICLPNGLPECKKCPLNKECYTYKHQLFDEIPYRHALKSRKIIHRTILIIRDHTRFVLHKRPSSGVLANLYEFVGVDEILNRKEVLEKVEALGFSANHIKKLPSSKHIFTHLEWHMDAYEIQVSQIKELKDSSYILKTKKELENFAIPSAFKTYVEYYALRD